MNERTQHNKITIEIEFIEHLAHAILIDIHFYPQKNSEGEGRKL